RPFCRNALSIGETHLGERPLPSAARLLPGRAAYHAMTGRTTRSGGGGVRAGRLLEGERETHLGDRLAQGRDRLLEGNLVEGIERARRIGRIVHRARDHTGLPIPPPLGRRGQSPGPIEESRRAFGRKI